MRFKDKHPQCGKKRQDFRDSDNIVPESPHNSV